MEKASAIANTGAPSTLFNNMSKEYINLSQGELEAILKDVASDAYKQGVKDGVDQAFQQMGEKIRGKAQQFSNPAVRFVLMELSDALIESPLAGR